MKLKLTDSKRVFFLRVQNAQPDRSILGLDVLDERRHRGKIARAPPWIKRWIRRRIHIHVRAVGQLKTTRRPWHARVPSSHAASSCRNSWGRAWKTATPAAFLASSSRIWYVFCFLKVEARWLTINEQKPRPDIWTLVTWTSASPTSRAQCFHRLVCDGSSGVWLPMWVCITPKKKKSILQRGAIQSNPHHKNRQYGC